MVYGSLQKPLNRTVLLGGILLLAFCLKLIYVFHFTHYKAYLFSDMGGYWYRAQERYNGNIFSVQQWTFQTLFFHIVLTEFFKITAFLGVFDARLEIALVLFALLSTLSAYGVFCITENLTNSFKTALAAMALYAVNFPLIYFNSAVLSENLAVPLMIAVTFCVICFNEKGWVLFLIGLLLGCVVSMRPIFGLMGLPFFLYIALIPRLSFQSFFRALCFSFGFVLLLLFTIMENNYVSKGQLKSLSSHAPVAMFTQFCKPRSVKTTFYGGVSFADSPLFMQEPKYGEFRTDHPYYDHDYFRKLTLDCIRENPSVWVENLGVLAQAFLQTQSLFPFLHGAKGRNLWVPFFGHLATFIFISIPLYFFLMPKEKTFLAKTMLLLSPIFCTLFTGYFFAIEPRYLISCTYGLYVVFFAMIPALVRNFRASLLYYAGFALLVGMFLGGQVLYQKNLEKTFQASIVEEYPIERAHKQWPNGTPGNTMGMLMLPNLRSAVLLKLKKPATAKKMEISTDTWDSYRVEFYLNGKKQGEMLLPPAHPVGGGVFKRTLPMPDSLTGRKFNQILVRPIQGDGFFSLASLILDPS